MNWSKMIISASLFLFCSAFAQVSYAQPPAKADRARQEVKENNRADDHAIRSQPGKEIVLPNDPIQAKMNARTNQKEKEGEENENTMEEKKPQGKAHGKNKGDLKGKNFGKDRAEQGRSKEKPGKSSSKGKQQS